MACPKGFVCDRCEARKPIVELTWRNATGKFCATCSGIMLHDEECPPLKLAMIDDFTDALPQ